MLSEETDNAIANYFRDNLIDVRKTVNAEEFRKFATLTTNAERVNFILNYPNAHVLPLEVENAQKKDLDKALKIKDIGNKYYGAGDYARALENYSNSILVAPRKELGIFLANRSAVLHQIGKHNLALSDIEECLKIGYPKELLYKIEERRAKCLLALECHSEAIEAFRKTLLALDHAKASPERRRKIESDVRVMIAVMEKGDQLRGKKGLKNQQQKLGEHENNLSSDDRRKATPRILEINRLYPSCSKSVDIRNDGGTIGRHAVATRDISPGELLVVEKPHSAVLLGEYRFDEFLNAMKNY